MTRDEYIASLADALSFLNEDTRAAALAFYTEMLDDRMEDGMDEQSAVAAMDQPEAIAARLRAENGVEEAPFQAKQAEEAIFEEANFSSIVKDAMRSAEEAVKAAEAAAKHSAQEALKAAEFAAKHSADEAQKVAEAARKHAKHYTNSPQNTDEYEKRTLSCPASDIHAVRLQAVDMPIKITASENDEIVLTYYTCERDEYRAYVQDGVLILEPASSVPGARGFSFSFLGRQVIKVLWSQSAPTVELAVPADALIDLTVKTSNGSIQAQDLQALCETNLTTSNSRIVLENITCKQLFAHTSNGRLVFKNIDSKRGLQGRTSNSRIEGELLRSGGDMNLTTSNGPLTVTNAKCDGLLTLKASNSRLNVQQVASAGAMTLTTSNGALTVDEISAPGLTLHTSNSSIRGTLPGPQSAWHIDSGTSNGRNSLPKQQPGEKPLSVHTSNGSIDLVFSK